MQFRSSLTGREKRIVFFAIGLGAYAMAVNMFFSPKPSELGLLKILEQWLLDSFGSMALPVFWIVVGTTLILAAIFSKD